MSYPNNIPVRILPGSPIPFQPGDRVELTEDIHDHVSGELATVTRELPLGHNVRRSVVVRFDDHPQMFEVPTKYLDKV